MTITAGAHTEIRSLKDAAIPAPSVELSTPAAPSDTVTFTVSKDTINALPSDLREAHGSGYRLKPDVFRDLILILTIERDPPVS